MQPQSEALDAIVVGSGISGGWAAKELTERGLRVLMLERGKDIEHIKDYPNARKAPWEKATKALGPKFDVKAFNDTVVVGGNVPLDVLARNVDEYVRIATS